jgi:CBS-domain-containing membrane protein
MIISELNECSLGVTDKDIIEAMKKIPGYLDITPNDFMEVYQMAYRHAFKRLTSSIKAEDVMTKEVIVIDENASLIDTAKLLASHNISGIPVLNAEKKVSGIISEKDFLKREPKSEQLSFMHVIISCMEEKNCVAKEFKGLLTKDIMSKPPLTVNTDTTVLTITNIFKSHNINRVPVMDQHSNLVGIIARSDLIHTFC